MSSVFFLCSVTMSLRTTFFHLHMNPHTIAPPLLHFLFPAASLSTLPYYFVQTMDRNARGRVAPKEGGGANATNTFFNKTMKKKSSRSMASLRSLDTAPPCP